MPWKGDRYIAPMKQIISARVEPWQANGLKLLAYRRAVKPSALLGHILARYLMDHGIKPCYGHAAEQMLDEIDIPRC